MAKRTLTAVLLLLPALLLGQADADSLFRVFEQSGGSRQNAVANQLIEQFEQEDLYDWPVSERRSGDRKFNEMLVYLGMGLHKLGASQFAQAADLGVKTEKMIPKDSLRWMSSCYELLNVAYFRQGEFVKALDYAQKDYEMGERLGDDRIRSSALNSLAAIHCYTQHLDKALEYIDRAIEIERKGNDDRALAIRLGVKCEILLLADRPDEALTAIEEAIDIDRKAGRTEKVGIRLSQKSDIFANQQQWEECRATCLQALEIFDKVGNKVDKIITLRQLGACETQLKLYDESEEHLLEGEVLCLQTGFRPQLCRIQHNLSNLYRETGRLDKALDYLERYAALKDSLNEERQQKIIGEYQLRFDLKEKEQEVEMQRATIRNRNIIAYSLLALILLALVLAFYAYRLAKIRQKRNTELEEANLIKDRYFSIISHDLKNPVKAQTQLLGHLGEHYDEVDDTTKKRQIQALKESGEHLNELLTNLLDWASIESGRMTCNPIRVDLAAVVRKSVKLVQTAADEKQIRIVPQLSENCYAFTDLNFVETILRNLLSNAIKFSHPGGSVEVVAAQDDDGNRIALSVVDHGVGINDELKAKLFRKQEISTLGTREETGTGLGLTVCHTLAQLAHADLTFESTHGTGSTFTLHLPTNESSFNAEP